MSIPVVTWILWVLPDHTFICVGQELLDVKHSLGEARLRCAARLDPIIRQRAVV